MKRFDVFVFANQWIERILLTHSWISHRQKVAIRVIIGGGSTNDQRIKNRQWIGKIQQLESDEEWKLCSIDFAVYSEVVDIDWD